MTKETAKKAREILNALEETTAFLKQYDECYEKMIAIRSDFLSKISSTLEFHRDETLKNMIREYLVCKIESLEKQLEEL